MKMKKQPTLEQLQALLDFSRENGKNWKQKLSDCWMTGDYKGFASSSILQQIRNSFGPSWLDSFSFQKHT